MHAPQTFEVLEGTHGGTTQLACLHPNSYVDGWTDGWMHGSMDGWMDRSMHEVWMHAEMNGGGWMDTWIAVSALPHSRPPRPAPFLPFLPAARAAQAHPPLKHLPFSIPHRENPPRCLPALLPLPLPHPSPHLPPPPSLPTPPSRRCSRAPVPPRRDQSANFTRQKSGGVV